MAVPAFTPFTLPLLDTVAIPVSELFHVTLWSANVEGATVAVSVDVLPFCRVSVVLSRLTLPTVTLQLALSPVAFEVQVIVAVPAFTPFTLPLVDTVAIFVFELFQVTLLSSNVEGYTVAFSVSVLPVLMEAVVLSSLT